jgi:hypothetical protein
MTRIYDDRNLNARINVDRHLKWPSGHESRSGFQASLDLGIEVSRWAVLLLQSERPTLILARNSVSSSMKTASVPAPVASKKRLTKQRKAEQRATSQIC